ncbi:MAG: preprotein translocase subunit SecG [Chitinivibrionales bacterium]|nr:preprotein translocase subunit SecG [Chitinivibrionales bacterium]MBD3396910.1 preprotein translocase subunit SecG [Chitinivibrionales bacterium]
MLFGIAVVVYVLVCILLVLLVIIQSDKGGGISGAIGGGLSGANQFLGTQDTANILTRLTTGLAIGYMCLCIVLSLFLSRSTMEVRESELKKRAQQREKFSPSSALSGSLPLKQESGGTQTGSLPVQEAQPAEQNETPAGQGQLPIREAEE